MSEFELEDRYYVLKKSDVLKYGHPIGIQALDAIVESIQSRRQDEGKRPLRAVVIESDWAIYPKAVELIKQQTLLSQST